MGAVAQLGEVKVRGSPCATFLLSLTKFLATAVISLHNRYLSIYLNSAPERQTMNAVATNDSLSCLSRYGVCPNPPNAVDFFTNFPDDLVEKTGIV